MRWTSLAVIVSLTGAAACHEAIDEPAGYWGAGPRTGATASDAGAAPTPAAVCTMDVPTVVLAPSCGSAGCHGAQNAADALDLASPGVAQRVVGKRAIGGGLLADPAHPEASVLYLRLLGKGGPRMPMSAPPLDDHTTACVLAWIGSLGAPGAGSPPASGDPNATPTTTDAGTTPPPAVSRPTIRVAAGAPAAYVDQSGQTWSADTGFSGGRVANNSPPLDVAQTAEDALYSNERYGADANGNFTDFSYSFAVPDGAYTVTLKFAETYSGAMGVGLRVFDVAVDGTKKLTDFDIYAAGGASAAVDESFDVNVAGGTLRLDFQRGAVQAPKVNAIQIVPK